MTGRSLFVIHEGRSPNTLHRVELLQEAAYERAIPFIAIDSLTCDHTDLPKLERGDMLFNCGRGSALLETLLTVPGIATFRSAQPRWIDNGGEMESQKGTGINCAGSDEVNLLVRLANRC